MQTAFNDAGFLSSFFKLLPKDDLKVISLFLTTILEKVRGCLKKFFIVLI